MSGSAAGRSRLTTVKTAVDDVTPVARVSQPPGGVGAEGAGSGLGRVASSAPWSEPE